MKNIKSIRFLCTFLFILVIPTYGENKSNIFSTWEGFEVDKCASIWLFKSFINKNSEIKFFPKGTIISKGTPFDTPDAKLRRYHNMSTYETILKQYNLIDPKLLYIGKIIHDIEINIWDRKVIPETYIVKNDIINIIMKSKSNDRIIEKSINYFDLLYKNIKVKRPLK